MSFSYRRDVSATLVQSAGSDEFICKAARVSTLGTESLDTYEAKGLINFLAKNRHGSPFEHGTMTFLIEAPIFVAREFMRHRIGWSYNEESGRYKELDGVFYLPASSRPLQQVGKTGAYEFVEGTLAQKLVTGAHFAAAYYEAYEAYQTMLKNGVAKEVARMVLPVGTFTSFYATCNPRSLMAFLSLRTKVEDSMFPSYPQREIEMVAEQMEEQFAFLFPLTHDSFNKNGRVAP